MGEFNELIVLFNTFNLWRSSVLNNACKVWDIKQQCKQRWWECGNQSIAPKQRLSKHILWQSSVSLEITWSSSYLILHIEVTSNNFADAATATAAMNYPALASWEAKLTRVERYIGEHNFNFDSYFGALISRYLYTLLERHLQSPLGVATYVTSVPRRRIGFK